MHHTVVSRVLRRQLWAKLLPDFQAWGFDSEILARLVKKAFDYINQVSSYL